MYDILTLVRTLKIASMKRFLIILLVGVSIKTYSQNRFNDFLKDLTNFKYPLDYNIINAPKISVSRKTSWEFWILPITQINKTRPDSLSSFIFDTTVINMYHRWDKKNWSKKEPIYLYCPIMTGELFCIGKTNINDKTIGIIWYFSQKDITYGLGPHFWLATYNLKGNLIDYIKIYEKTSAYMGVLSEYEKKCEFYNNRIVLKDIRINENLDNFMKYGENYKNYKPKYDTTIVHNYYMIDSIGRFIIDKK